MSILRSRRTTKRSRPWLEALEDRTLPATFTPTIFSDGDLGSGSLRDAILQANADPGSVEDVIVLQAGAYQLSLANGAGGQDNSAASGDLDITSTAHPLTIKGMGSSGPNQTTIDAVQIDRVFQLVNPGTQVVFEDLVITGGMSSDDGKAGAQPDTSHALGGGILNNGGKITLRNVAIQGNVAQGGLGFNGLGGGLYSTGNGSVNIEECTVAGNSALGASGLADPTSPHVNASSGQGGGLYLNGGTVTIIRSTIAENVAAGGLGATGASGATGQAGAKGGNGGNARGAGLYINAGAVTVTNSTVSSNQATGGDGGMGGGGGPSGTLVDTATGGGTAGTPTGTGTGTGKHVPAGAGGTGGNGGAAQGAGIYLAAGALVIGNSTIAGNTVNAGHGADGGANGNPDDPGGPNGSDGAGQGGGLFIRGTAASPRLSNTILATNSANDKPNDLSGALDSRGHNLIGTTGGGSGFVSTDLRNLDPVLGELNDNGGPTRTILLLAGSPAVDAGNNAGAPLTDQRGLPRVVGGSIDIGAVESQADLMLSAGAAPDHVMAGDILTYSLSVVNNGPDPAGFVTLIDSLPAGTTFQSLAVPEGWSANTPAVGENGRVIATVIDLALGTYAFTLMVQVASSAPSGMITNQATAATRGDPDTADNTNSTDVTVRNPATHYAITAPAKAGPGDPLTVTVTARDAFEHTDIFYTGTVQFSSSDGAAGLPPDYLFTATDNGAHAFSLTLNTLGPQSITVTDDSTASITARADIAVNEEPAQLVFAQQPASTAAGAFLGPVIVHLLDRFNNLVSSDNIDVVRLGILANSATATPTLGGTTTVKVVNGVATFADLSVKTLAGAAGWGYTLFAACGTLPVALSDAFDISPQALIAPATYFSVSAGAKAVAGKALDITVTARNAKKQRDTGYVGTVRFTSTDPRAVVLADYTFTPADKGQHTFSVTLLTAGSRSIRFTDTLRKAVTGMLAVPVSPAVAASFQLAGYPSLTVPGAVHTFSVTALDVFGNRASGYRGTIQLTSSDLQAVLPGTYTFTASDLGKHSFSATLKTVGAQSLTAADTVSGSITGSEAGIRVSRTTHFAVTAQASAAAGDSIALVVTAKNALKQTDTAYQGSVHLTSSDPQAVLPADYTFLPGDNGTATFMVTIKKAGTQTITFKDTSAAITGKATINVIPAAARSFLISYPAPTLAGTARTFSVTAVDAFGNRATAYRGRVTFNSGDGLAVLPGPYTFTSLDQGRHTFSATFNTVGSHSLNVIDTVTPSIFGTASVDVCRLAASVAGPGTGVRGQPLTFTLHAIEGPLPSTSPILYRIDWNGDGVVDQKVTGPDGINVVHVFPASGKYKVKVTAGLVGGATTTSSRTVAIAAAALQTDASGTSLFVGGTTANDTIVLSPTNTPGNTGDVITVTINGKSLGSFHPTARIFVYGQAGNDTIRETATPIGASTILITIPAIIDAGAGNDTISAAGSSAGNILLGGAGADVLKSGSGRSIAIGGRGADNLQAGSDGAILIGGTTTWDAQPMGLAALASEWARTDADYKARIDHLFAVSADGQNGTFLLNLTTVANDSAVNRLTGGTGLDWLFFNVLDAVNALAAGEVATPI